MHDLRRTRSAIVAVAVAAALSACGSGGTPAPTAPPSAAIPVSGPAATAEAPVTEPITEPAPDVAPAAVENALIEASGCTIGQYDRGADAAGFALAGFGPSGSPRPHDPLEESFTCAVAPNGTLTFAAARFADATQATESATWLQGGDSCHPLATVGPWTVLAARALGKPQQSSELEGVVSDLGGRMVATCR